MNAIKKTALFIIIIKRQINKFLAPSKERPPIQVRLLKTHGISPVNFLLD